MRHRVGHRKLGRLTDHRLSMLRNQAEALLTHEHITTTLPKAKELRPFVEKLITVAKRGVKAAEPKGKTLAAKRQVGRDLVNDEVVSKLFADLAPRFMERPGGYTRILKLGFRRGDGAETALVELVGSEFDPKKAAAEKAAAAEAGGEEQKAKKSLGERLRGAASRIRGGKKGGDGGGGGGRTTRPSRAPQKKGTTPRKAGGS
jgi:large subunit ribosomal protein L17